MGANSAVKQLALTLAVLALPLGACDLPVGAECTNHDQCTSRRCIRSKCVPGPDAGDGNSDGGQAFSGCSRDRPNNGARDTDCDGLSDADEYELTYPGGKQTDPCNPDSDGDGILDGVETAAAFSPASACTSFVADLDPLTRSNPTLADTDGDGISDGEEDLNKNGRADFGGESDPARVDSDCDGLSDKAERDGTYGCALDPLRRDSDDDGLADGLEVGTTAPGADPLCNYPPSVFDADPATRTNGCNADSDGDGIADGAEDSNVNGRVDPGELSPLDPTDAIGPARDVCTVAGLRPVTLQKNAVADVALALGPQFTEIRAIEDTSGERGLMFHDPTNQIAGVVVLKKGAGTTATAEEFDGRGRLNTVGAISTPLTQTFSTWDKRISVRATYDQAGGVDLKARANAIANAFLPAGGLQGGLLGTAGITGPFKIQAQYVQRSLAESVVVIAITPAGLYAQNIFNLDNVAGGSALARYADYAASQCEVFDSASTPTVDFLWVVDNSGSMQAYQAAVGATGTVFADKLATAGIDWRAGGVTTDFYQNTITTFRPFTSDIATMQGWFAPNGPTSFGISGAGIENGLQSAGLYIQTLLPKTTVRTANKIRQGASLHVILLGDADDQNPSGSIQSYSQFFNSYDGAGSSAVVHGIVCPDGNDCNEQQETPRRMLGVIADTGGVSGDITIAQTGAASPQLNATVDAILTAAIAGTGHMLVNPPVASTLKVSLEPGGTQGPCKTSNMPRDRVHGFDFDSPTRRIIFYGNCRPSSAGKKVAVSYRYLLDGSGFSNTCGCAPPRVCGVGGTCECPANCGNLCPATRTCDMQTCSCAPK